MITGLYNLRAPKEAPCIDHIGDYYLRPTDHSKQAEHTREENTLVEYCEKCNWEIYKKYVRSRKVKK